MAIRTTTFVVCLLSFAGPQITIAAESEDLHPFPPDYISRLWNAIETVDPEFADSYRQFKASQTAIDTP